MVDIDGVGGFIDFVNTNGSLDNVQGCGGGAGGGDFLRNRKLHKAVIIAMLVANPRNENEKYRNGPINEMLSIGILLPMTYIIYLCDFFYHCHFDLYMLFVSTILLVS